MNFPSVMKTAQKLLTDHSPAILTSLGVAGAVTTAILTGKASIQADRVVRDALIEQSGPYVKSYTKRELVELTWKEFIPPVIMGAVTITCIIAANHVSTRRAAALAAGFKVAEEMATEYRAKVVDQIGKNAEEKIQVAVAKDRMEHNPVGSTIIITGDKTLMYDAFSGRYFEGSIEGVKKAVNEINFDINSNYYSSLTDFYDKIGLPRTSASDEFGWNADQQLEVEFVAVIMNDGKVVVQMHYDKSPVRGYARVH